MREFLVALMIATPAVVVPGVSIASSQATVLVALLAAFLKFVEYSSTSPSTVEFRAASPFNRLRFVALYLIVFLLSVFCKGKTDPTLLTGALTSVGTIVGNSIDFPFSPVRLMVLMLPGDASAELVRSVRTAAGLSYLISLTAMAAFLFLVRVFGWLSRSGAFNMWVNLPLFDPTAGGDVLHRLNRDARINIALGFLLPFIIPAVVKLAADLLNSISLENPQTLIWTMSAWAFLPASMIMRCTAMQRIAEMIHDQRKRAYANAESDFQVA